MPTIIENNLDNSNNSINKLSNTQIWEIIKNLFSNLNIATIVNDSLILKKSMTLDLNTVLLTIQNMTMAPITAQFNKINHEWKIDLHK